MIEYQPDLGVGLPKMDKETQEQSEEDEDDSSSYASGELRFKCTYAILLKELASIEDSKSGQCLGGFSVRPLQINSLFPVLDSSTFACGRAVHFHYFILRLAAFQAIICLAQP